MAYYLHRLRCWLALMRAAWTRAGAEGSHADWQFQREVTRKQQEHAERLAKQLVKMRRVRP